MLRRAGFSRVRIVPQLSQVLDGTAHLIQAREIDPEDFLARNPVKVDLRKSLAYVRGRRVLVTGAGGSIGSELCRQLLEGGAERLYLFGHGENSLYEIERELRLLQEEGVGERATIVPILGEIQDREYMAFILRRTRAAWSSTPRRTSTCRCWRPTPSRRSRTTCSARATSWTPR